MAKIELSKEEQLVLENLRLKVQVAEMQRVSSIQALAAYTRELLAKHQIPETVQATLSEGTLEVHEAPQSLGATSAEPADGRVLSQAEAEAQSLNDKAA